MSGARQDSNRAIARVIAALVVLAVLLALRPDRWLVAPPASSTPTSPAGPDAAGPRATPAPHAAWRTLAVAPLAQGPAGATSVVTSPAGSLAVRARAGGSVEAWMWAGRGWADLPAGTFGSDGIAVDAVAALGGLVVAVDRSDGSVACYRSLDGQAWAPAAAPPLALGHGTLAGTAGGLLGVVGGDPGRLAFSGDGVTWQVAAPPGLNRSDVVTVATYGEAFVALGSQLLPVVATDGASGAGQPSREVVAAWWSTDGLTWRSAALGDLLQGRFSGVWAGSEGLVALSVGQGGQGRVTYWQSVDGRSWSVSETDPLGLVAAGPGAGSAIGRFAGDGDRLLVSGSRGTGQPIQYWTSFDGTAWHRLELAGDTSAVAAATADSVPYLLPDGVLLIGDTGTWFGAASP